MPAWREGGVRGLQIARAMAVCVVLVCLMTPLLAKAAGGSSAHWSGLIQELLQSQAPASSEGSGAPTRRIEVVLGELDPRLKLAPCQQVKAYMPQGATLWGKTRVGLRCEQGSVKWNVYWPVTVKVWGQGVVAAAAVEPGQEMAPEDVVLGEVDLAESNSPVLLALSDVLGRSAQRRMAAGQAVRQSDLKARRWFSAGDPVRLQLKGEGFMAAAEGTALSHGDEGRCARIRTHQGRVVCAQPTAKGLAELTL